MKREWEGLRCVYCGVNTATTDDHIFATGFFHKADTDGKELPKVPACEKCNGAKSKLDEYVMTVLAFGSLHSSAVSLVESVGIRRVQNNKALQKKLQEGVGRVWMKQASGIFFPTVTYKIDAQPIEDFLKMVGKALLWHHWKVYLDANRFVTALFHSEEVSQKFRQLFREWPGDSVRGDLRKSTVLYEGLHTDTDPQFSAWRIAIYGGVHLATKNPADGVCRTFGIVTGKPKPSTMEIMPKVLPK